MTRRHFEAFAEMVAALPLTDSERLEVASGIADVCHRFNPRFCEVRFVRACFPNGDMPLSEGRAD